MVAELAGPQLQSGYSESVILTRWSPYDVLLRTIQSIIPTSVNPIQLCLQ